MVGCEKCHYNISGLNGGAMCGKCVKELKELLRWRKWPDEKPDNKQKIIMSKGDDSHWYISGMYQKYLGNARERFDKQWGIAYNWYNWYGIADYPYWLPVPPLPEQEESK